MNKKTLLPIILLIFSFIIIGCGNSAADTVIIGTIYTSEADQKMVSAVAIKDGVYKYVGDEEGVKEFIGDNTEVINLESGMAMPSFFEAHAHAELGGIGKLYQVELYDGKSMKDYEEIVSNFVAEHEGLKILRGSGWGNGYTPKNGPTKDVLDRISTEIPIVLTSQDYHSIWVNSKAMEIAGVDANTPDVEGGVIERDPVTKEPTGTFREKAQDLILTKLPDYSIEEYKNGILAYQDEALSYGVTSIFNPLLNMNTDGKNLFSALNELDKSGDLKLTYFSGYQVLAENDPISNLNVIADLKKQANGNKFKLTTVKLFADGVVEGKTAYLLDDYASDPGFRSVGLWEQDAMNEVCLKAEELGLQIHIHSIGDAAARLSVNALEHVQKNTGATNKRHAITHLQVVNKDDIKRMGELNIVAVANPYWFFKEDGYYYELELPYLGEERASKEYPMKDLFDAGCVVSLASDYPVTVPPRPLDGIQIGATRMNLEGEADSLLGADQIVSVEQMMDCATINGAYQNFAEDTLGSIKVGKKADFIILDKNILEIAPTDITKTKVLKTYIDGKLVYQAA
ncbi:amidohydrolase family protein [uncultured Brachyspira sp.]|uniref:amidohydrolase n=1 Tax=uncultured Brachyspira sp. TaxID=221953 RepID=UPI00263533D6|nr:amidohydrolase family protein [uncultured Brachyspira sp.]